MDWSENTAKIVLWKLLLQWSITIYELFSKIIDSDLWIFFFNDWLWFINHFHQWLIWFMNHLFNEWFSFINHFIQRLIMIYTYFLPWFIMTYESFSSMNDYNLQTTFFNAWLRFANDVLQRLITICQWFSSMIGFHLRQICCKMFSKATKYYLHLDFSIDVDVIFALIVIINLHNKLIYRENRWCSSFDRKRGTLLISKKEKPFFFHPILALRL